MLLLQDLYKPDANRLRRNLSGIINFAKFREEKLIPYTDLQESVEHLLEETAGLEELNMQLVCLTSIASFTSFAEWLFCFLAASMPYLTPHCGPVVSVPLCD